LAGPEKGSGYWLARLASDIENQSQLGLGCGYSAPSGRKSQPAKSKFLHFSAHCAAAAFREKREDQQPINGRFEVSVDQRPAAS
jgi:hypothetical protein